MNRQAALVLVFAVAAGVFLTGCATGYGPRGFAGGYSNIQVAANVFEVCFNGNGYTSAERAADFALLRCAEVAAEHGFQYFMVVESDQDASHFTYTGPTQTTSRTTVSANGNFGAATTRSTITPGQTYHFTKPSSHSTSVCFTELSDMESGVVVYDVSLVSSSVRAKYRMK